MTFTNSSPSYKEDKEFILSEATKTMAFLFGKFSETVGIREGGE